MKRIAYVCVSLSRIRYSYAPWSAAGWGYNIRMGTRTRKRDECPGAAQALLLSDKSHIFADQINLIDITQNDGGKVSTFIFAFAKKKTEKRSE